MLPDWDGPAAKRGLLPPWAQELIRTCDRYTFTTTQVYQGRSVLARRISGTGPDVVITRSEDEMRDALGLKRRTSPAMIVPPGAGE
jgi:hypothetical protein